MNPRILKIIANWCGISEADIKPTSHLEDDLGLDSLGMIETIMSIEQEFEIEISDSEIDALTTFDDLCALVERLAVTQ